MNSKFMLAALVAAVAFGSQSAYAQESTSTPEPNGPPDNGGPPIAVNETPVNNDPAPAATPYVPQPEPVLPASMSQAYHPDLSAPVSHPFRVGFGMDFGLPAGVALGLVLNPKLDWLRLEASVTYNYLSFGGRGSVQLDPMALLPNCPVGLFADLQGGFSPTSNIPGHADLPQVGYDYFNAYGGLRLGKPNGFHWNFEFGPTYMHVATNNFQAALNKNGAGVNGLTIGNPTVNGWVVPTFETGFAVVWP
jgi:hypothetical protein